MKTYIADTNIVIAVSNAINNKNKQNKNINALANLVEKRKIQLLITPTVYDELKKGEIKDGGQSFDFVQKYCQYYYLTDEQEKLANYLRLGYMTGENSAIKDRNGKKNNNKDALILAEATVCYNCCKLKIAKFITDNVKDFANSEQIEYIDRALDMKSISINSNQTKNMERKL